MMNATDPDVRALVDALTAQVRDRLQAEAIEAEREATIALGFLRIAEAIRVVGGIEAEKAARIRAGFEGVCEAIRRAWLAQVENHATRPVKMAIFDAEGRFVGSQEGRADLVHLHQADGYVRLAWRAAWDAAALIAPDGAGPRRFAMRPAVPDLSEIPGAEAEIVGQVFGMFAANVLRP